MSGQHHDASIHTVQQSDNDDNTKQNIGIYLRVRPSSEASQALSVAEDMRGVHICIPRSVDYGCGFVLAIKPHILRWPMIGNLS